MRAVPSWPSAVQRQAFDRRGNLGGCSIQSLDLQDVVSLGDCARGSVHTDMFCLRDHCELLSVAINAGLEVGSNLHADGQGSIEGCLGLGKALLCNDKFAFGCDVGLLCFRLCLLLSHQISW